MLDKWVAGARACVPVESKLNLNFEVGEAQVCHPGAVEASPKVGGGAIGAFANDPAEGAQA